MRTHEDLLEILGEEDMAMISADFWFLKNSTELLLEDTQDMHDNPDHPIWKELNAFQNGWLACKEAYKIND